MRECERLVKTTGPKETDPAETDVTVFGKMPYENGHRLIGIRKSGAQVWGPSEKKGSVCANGD